MKCLHFILLCISLLVASSCSSNSQWSLEEGKELYENRRYNEAITHLEQVYLHQSQHKELAWKYLRKSKQALYQKQNFLPSETKKAKQPPTFLCKENNDYKPQPLVSMNLLDADLKEALIELSTISEVSIIADATVEGVVTVNIEEKRLEVALEMILAAGNHSFKKIDDFYLVGESSIENPSFHLLSNTCVYKPAHLKPQEIRGLLPPYFHPYIQINDKRGLITITAPLRLQRRLQKDILQFDKKPPQILLEMKIIEVTSHGREALGLDWFQGTNKNGQGNGDRSAFSNSNQGLNFKVLSGTNFLQTNLHWLTTTGNATIKATPSIVSLDGQEASFSSQSSTWLDLYAEESNQKKEMIRYGVTLKILPHIAQDNMVLLDIKKAEVSDLVTNKEGRYRVITHSISTTVMVREGESLVLGGLLQTKSKSITNKIKFLGSIPFFGWLFSTEINIQEETEVLIIIRPKIQNNQEWFLSKT